jgi:hypothetical protein
MSQAVIISRDDALHERMQNARVVWVDSPEKFEAALEEGFDLALVDVCTDCGCDHDVAEIVRECRTTGKAQRVVAFLTGCGGDAAVRAHLAGADRVIPVDQLEDELEGFFEA